jgi:acyl-homoserine-lactone acylase
MKFRSALLYFLISLSFILNLSSVKAQTVEILWDEWGVPHIFAANDMEFFYAFGWAQTQAHGDLILRLYGESRARAAEYWGEEFLEQDIRLRKLELPQLGQDIYDNMSAEWQERIENFAAGINDYAAANPELIDDAVEIVLPVTPQDILAHGYRVLNYEFIARSGISYAENLEDEAASNGSNGWAIAPSRTENGNAILLSNSHQPWYGFGRWTEFNMILPDNNFYGVTLVGSPMGTMGFNDNLGWTHTVNTHDGWDLYELTLLDENTYLFDGEALTFETYEETILVKDAEPMTVTVRRSVQGLVIGYEPENQRAYALRLVCDATCNPWAQWWDMGQAKSFDEFQNIMSRLDIPIFTTIYADRDGNIMHLFNERIPIRSEGDWAFWNNAQIMAVGDIALIPGDDSRYLWDSFHSYEELPKIVNPPIGWVQNANEAPWTGTSPPLNPNDYPTYFAPPPFAWPRPVQSMRLLLEMPETITFEDVVEMKFSTFVELTNWVLDDLIAAARELGDFRAEQAADVLENWDRYANADSEGATLFTIWALTYLNEVGDTALAEPWDYQNPLAAPRGLSNPEAAVQALSNAVSQMTLLGLSKGINISSAYGDVFRLRVEGRDIDIPASGSYDVMGTFAVLTFVPDDDGLFYPVHGDTFIAVVEFSDPIRAEALLTHGNATQADSPFRGDQLEMYANRELRPVLRSRDAIEAHLYQQIELTMP